MNALEAYRQSNNMTFKALAKRTSKGTSLVWKHCQKSRIPADAVPGYEATLGIPRWMLRPDLWPAPGPAPGLGSSEPVGTGLAS